MSISQGTEEYFLRRSWNENWDYPASGAIFSLERDYPALAPFYFSFEANFNPVPLIKYCRRNSWLAVVCAALYLLFVFIGPRMMQSRKAFDLRTPLRYWNLFLSVFSLWGAIRVVPHLALYVWKIGFNTTLCVPPIWGFGSGAVGFWATLFVFSKFIELIDTVFIVLRKRPLSFLHWYHHATVLLYAWSAFVTEQPAGIYFCAMNFSVHSVMYFYYYLASTMSKPPKWGIYVTILQISQMFIGTAVTLLSMKFSFDYPFLPYTTSLNAFQPFAVPGCYTTQSNLLACLAMYSTYFYLFAAFFWSRYVSSKKQTVVPINKKTS